MMDVEREREKGLDEKRKGKKWKKRKIKIK